jgi:acyl dehydratase
VNPIHLSAASAKAFGFPRAIAHGMHTAARLLAGVGAARGDAFAWEVAFAAPVLLPSSPVARVARVARSSEGADGFDLALWDPKRGKVHVTGAVRPIE